VPPRATHPPKVPFTVTSEQLLSLAWPAIAFAIAVVILLLLRHFVLRWIRSKATAPHSFAAVLVGSIRLGSILWCLAAAIAIAFHISEMTPRQVHTAVVLIIVFLVISFTFVAASIAVRMMAAYGERAGIPFVLAGLSRTLIWIFFLSLGALMLVDYLGLSITPWLTALGVGGLAVALALKDTLANFFAGIHILLERPIAVGDWIRLSTGEEGAVNDIGWRTTRILTGDSNLIVIPNTNITSSTLTNFSSPASRVAASVSFIVAHGADLERVAGLAIEVAKHTPGVLADAAPVVLFDPGYTITHLGFKLVFQVEAQPQVGGVQSALRVALVERFLREGIALPSTQMVVPG
jgi:small-conductance mechanosensitive channel